MSPTSVSIGANSIVAALVATAGCGSPVTSSEMETDGQLSFARIMSGATAGDTTDESPSIPTSVPEDKSEKDGKREDDKTRAELVAQMAATLVPPQTPLPVLIVSTAKTSSSSTTPGSVPLRAEAAPATPLAAIDVLGQMITSTDKGSGSSPRNPTNAKQSTIEPLPNDLEPSSMSDKEFTKETQSGGASSQTPGIEPSSSSGANPTLIENPAQPVLAMDAGTAIAKQVGRMKMQDKTENNSEVAEKNLPPTSFVVPMQVTGDGAKPRLISANLQQREEHNSAIIGAPPPILASLGQGKAQSAETYTGVEAMRSPQTDKVFTEISEHVMSFRRMGADSAEVNLHPDSNTEITLSLSLRNGQVEMTARLERGNIAALNPHWTGLQQSLSQQGVRVGQLTSSQSAMNDQLSSGTFQQGAGENTSQFFDRGLESLEDHPLVGSMTEPVKGQPQKAVTATGRSWEMWA